MGLTNPSTNSYKRLVPGMEAPLKAFFGLGSRDSAVRIPKYANTPLSKRIEFRIPDATGNIYLMMAAQLMAGLDGIINRINPVERGFGPIEELSDKQRTAHPYLPRSLEEALYALANDHEFLLVGDVFSEDLIKTWINWKREKEDKELQKRPHPYEIELYFNV